MFKYKNRIVLLIVFVFATLLATVVSPKALAITCPDGYANDRPFSQVEFDTTCASHKTGGPEVDGTEPESTQGSLHADCEDPNINKSNCGIVAWLVKIVNVLSGIVGAVIVLMITFRGVQYVFSRDDPKIAAAAKSGMRDAVLALVYFLFIFSFLQWVIPGGLF